MVDFSKFTKERSLEIRKQMEEEENLIEQTICFTGHRPNKIGGYNLDNPIANKLKIKLTLLIEELIIKKNISRFITGGALGVDQIAFKRVHMLKEKYPHIQNILAVPFRDQSLAWPDKSQSLYKNRILLLADEIIYVDTLPDYAFESVPIGTYHAAKMQLRNNYMVDNSNIVIAVYDGTKGGTGNCINYARKKYKTIYTLNPQENFELTTKYGL